MGFTNFTNGPPPLTAEQLNAAFAGKADKPISPSDVPGFDGVTVTGTPSVGQVPTATSTTSATWQTPGGGGGDGTVTQVNTTSGELTGGPITTTGTLGLATTAVTPGNYTNTNLTVDSKGRITAATNGSGVAGQIAVAATITALASVDHTVFLAATVTDPIRGGTFAATFSNISTQVTNDPGQGIYVAFSSDTSGASGGWVRKFTSAYNLQFWGAIGDGATDNSLALANFGVFGRHIASLYGGLELFVPPGSYLMQSDSLCHNCLANLGKFRMVMPGTQWTNIQINPIWSWFTWTNAEQNGANGANENAFINTTTVGANTFTFTVPADSSNFSVGDVVMLASIDVQGFGFPANTQQYEYVTITDMTNSATTGVTGIAEYIKYQHRSDFPDFTTNALETIVSGLYINSTGVITLTMASGVAAIGTPVSIWPATGTGAFAGLAGTWPAIAGTGGTTYVLQGPASVGTSFIGSGIANSSYTFNGRSLNNACGKGRVWQLNTHNHTYGDGVGGNPALPNGGVLRWDGEYEFVGPSTFNVPTNANGFTQNYNTLSVRKFTSNHITGYGFSETVCEAVVHHFHTATSPLLPDKTVCSLSHFNLDASSSASGFNSQNSFEFVHFRDCRISGFTCATIKNLLVDNCEIASLGFVGNGYGVSQSQIFNNCRIYSQPVGGGIYNLSPNTGQFTVDGTNIIYTTAADSVLGSTYGVFKTKISTLTGTGWRTVVPGSYLSFSATASPFYPGDFGTMRVLRTWQDATWIYTVVDSPLTSLPSWCTTGLIYYWEANEVQFNNCTGCDAVRVYSDNYKNGLKFYEGQRFLFSGLFGSHGGTNPLFNPAGEISKISVNVISAGGTSGTGLNLSWNTYDYSSSYAPDSGGTVVGINTGVAGKRVFTQSASTTTFLGTDNITVGGASSTHLPLTRVVNGNYTYFTPMTGTGNQTPIVDIVIEYDTGQVCRLVPTQFNAVGDAIINIAGRLL